ncbi:hypothetical protein NE235_10825 [Actinoallomurus spadix]|uniref:Uncharacterized protein n=1 Tax=Actinoallomurus spadix TaxID=79912 RepID=A0ABN0WW43_9ACTN|nr:hypothetical protein [Actinoallomurus spadix]MCO5986596.1 hypothetical protein [Actinoallomurus spadix]
MSATRRPYWLPGNCPPWCLLVTEHRDDDHPEDRSHAGRDASVTLTAADPLDLDGEPEEMRLYLLQHYRECEPRIWLGRNDTDRGGHLTLDEAEALAAELRRLVKVGRGEDAGE